MLGEYIKALSLIFIAEMGDKTQILAMIFSMKYSVGKVLIGVFIGSLLNHGIAVVFGRLVGGLIPTDILQLVAGLAFIGFALWTLLGGDEEDDEDVKDTVKKRAILTVAMAFFIGELGDKTQLTAITLSVDALYPVFILLGTVSGMVLTSGVGIFIGAKFGSRIPDKLMQILSALVFTIFGVVKVTGSVRDIWVNVFTIMAFVVVLAIILFAMVKNIVTFAKASSDSRYQRIAEALYDYYNHIGQHIEEVCRGEGHCGQCQGSRCAIGFMRSLAKQSMERLKDDQTLNLEDIVNHIDYIRGKFDEALLIHMLAATYAEQQKHFNRTTDHMRNILEQLLLNQPLKWTKKLEDYTEMISNIDKDVEGIFSREYKILVHEMQVKQSS